MSKFFASPLGSFVKHFITAVFTILVSKYNEGVLCLDLQCLKSLIIAAIFATIPVIINYFNPNYKSYGVGCEPETNFKKPTYEEGRD
jgi:hypothetical protein